MKARAAAAFLFFACVPSLWADPALQQVQQALKDQGYYYGKVTGEKDADTTAAIRRYQIRNGLKVTGELNEETLRNLHSNSAALAQSPAPAAQGNRNPDVARGGETPEGPPVRPLLPQPSAAPPVPSTANLFGHTPYENAAPALQERVVRGAQTLLRSRGYYKGHVDGVFSPDLEFSLRAYQSRLGIQASGRFDMDTLASLGLLPGQYGPTFGPPRPRMLRPFSQAPLRGEWIPDGRERERERDEDDDND